MHHLQIFRVDHKKMSSYKYLPFLGMVTLVVLTGTIYTVEAADAAVMHACGGNEVYDPCFSTCPSESCNDLMLQQKCPAIPPNQCKGGCRCKMNYRRDEFGSCVPIFECPPHKCENRNEHFDYCPNPCDIDSCFVSIDCTDEERNKPYQCFPRCVCNEEYCRSSETQKCGLNVTTTCERQNEIWSECGNNKCQKTCDGLYAWSEVCKDTCRPGCICAPGFIKNRFGVCVTQDKCGEGVCGINEEYKFCRPCPRGMICVAICLGPSVCVCREGYVRDVLGACYKPKPKQCKMNEVFDICPLPEKTCTHVFNGNNPSKLITDICKPNCVCKDGYVRKNNGECVLPENCCADPNAKAVKCPYRCGGGTCANPVISEACKKGCPEPAPLGCQCNTGYTRLNAQSTKCIKITECPKK